MEKLRSLMTALALLVVGALIALTIQAGGRIDAARVNPASEISRQSSGSFRFIDPGTNHPITVWFCRTSTLTLDTRIVFIMHGGESETARQACDIASSYVDARKAIVLAPQFAEDYYPGDSYMFGDMVDPSGRVRAKSAWALTAVERLFDAVRDANGLRRPDYDIVGFSGGAQFVHRLVLFVPDARYRRAVAASAGRYAFVTWSDKFPYGLADSPLGRTMLATVLSRDLVVLLGDRDVTDREREAGSMAQGGTRFARGLRFFATAADEAAALGVPLRWRLRIVPDVAHSAPLMVRAALKELDRYRQLSSSAILPARRGSRLPHGEPARWISGGVCMRIAFATVLAAVGLPLVNLGLFKRDEGKIGDYTVVALANTTPSNMISTLSRALPIGSYDTASANRLALSEAQLSMQIFSDYFGPLTFKRIHITQQTACNYGQAWPGVIYIPTCYYWNPTLRHQLGFNQNVGGYWDSVASHEVGHLWWGHAVGWNSYRDQWMSEGFASFAASLFLQAAYPKEPETFGKYWKSMLDQLTQKNEYGFRAIDAGPLTQGYRLDSSRTGAVTQYLIYPKGAYVLHMLRMMMWSRDSADTRFKDMLRDFIATHRNRPITTEDFKQTVEKHMKPEMNLDGDGTMNWFFRQYVYGTELPTYKFEQSVDAVEGQKILKLKLTQSGVSDGFKMLVPLYAELTDGCVVRLGSATIIGNSTVEQKVPLGQVPANAR